MENEDQKRQAEDDDTGDFVHVVPATSLVRFVQQAGFLGMDPTAADILSLELEHMARRLLNLAATDATFKARPGESPVLRAENIMVAARVSPSTPPQCADE